MTWKWEYYFLEKRSAKSALSYELIFKFGINELEYIFTSHTQFYRQLQPATRNHREYFSHLVRGYVCDTSSRFYQKCREQHCIYVCYTKRISTWYFPYSCTASCTDFYPAGLSDTSFQGKRKLYLK